LNTLTILSTSGPDYTITGLSSDMSIGVTITSGDVCTNGVTSSQEVIDITLVPNVVPSVDVEADATTVCDGTTVTFTSSNEQNQGLNPIYEWFVNGNPVQNGPLDNFSYVPVNGDAVQLVLTSDELCALPSVVTATPASITLVVINNVTPIISITADQTSPICFNTPVNFTADTLNAGPVGAIIEWYAGQVGAEVLVGTGLSYGATSLLNQDNVFAVLFATNTCQTVAQVSSNVEVFTVTSNTPDVALSNDFGSNTICAGTHPLFTATPTLGGVDPVYVWTVNGVEVQNGLINTLNTGAIDFVNGDVVEVTMTSIESCLVQATAIASATITVTPLVTPAVTIALTSTEACPGDAITYTATEAPVSVGTSTFDWYVNGLMVQSSTNNVYSSSTFADNDSIYVVLNSAATCAVAGPVNSVTLAVFVDELFTPVLNAIIASQDSVCGSPLPVGFSADGADFGPSPVYNWTYTNINGVQTIFNTPTVSISNIVGGETVSLSIVPNNACQTVTNLGPITWTGIDGTVTPSVSITLDVDTFCLGLVEDFGVIAQNQGTSPVYNWYINGSLVSANNELFNTATLNSGDTVSVELISNASCLAIPGSVFSNEIIVTVDQPLSPIIDILVNGTTTDSICDFTNALISAGVTNPGTTVSYEWSLNGTVISDSIAFESDTLQTNDLIQLIVTNVNTCSTSIDTVTMNITVLPIPNISASLFTTLPGGVNQVCEGDNTTLFQLFAVQGVTNYTATWAFDSLSTGVPAIEGQSISLLDLPASLGDLQIEIVPLDLCASGVVYSNAVTIAPNLNYYLDADGDGFGDINGTPIFTCNPGPNYVADATDCDDANVAINPGATEICGDNLDNDCNGTIDDGSCPGVDADGDGYPYPEDCNDNDPAINPGAVEICGNAVDENCDGWDASVWYGDADADGFGDTTDIYLSYDCAVTEVIGYVSSADPLDCNDNEPTVYPGAPEICDSLDNDCNGFIDDGAGVVWFYDGDQDGFGAGDSIYPGLLCYEPGPDWSLVSGDCVNDNPLVFPFSDSDNDDALGCIDDCDDTNPSVSPNLTELCDSIDNDCDFIVDEGVQFYFYPDADNDDFGVANDSIGSCSFDPPAFYAANATDCNDADYNINPGATELCGNDVDENCDSELLGECFPDAFSPNGDGVGDVYVYRSPFRDAKITMEVFNRWGAKIYATSSVESEAEVRWNGFPNEGPEQSDVVPVGTYFAIFIEDGKQRFQTITIWK
jgi:hypothetical protein